MLRLELTDILRFTDYFLEIEKKIAGVQKALQKVENVEHVVVGFSGRIGDDAALTIIESLYARGSATFLGPQATATLLGGAELARQFEENNLESPFHFVYHFCYGIRLPDGKWLELVPKTWRPPYHRKKVFRVSGLLEKFDVQLFCGLSLTDNSDVHYLATLEIVPPKDQTKNQRHTSNRSMEFILSITLNDDMHGTFAVHFPNPQEPKSVEFTVPVLMD